MERANSFGSESSALSGTSSHSAGGGHSKCVLGHCGMVVGTDTITITHACMHACHTGAHALSPTNPHSLTHTDTERPSPPPHTHMHNK